MANFNLFKGKLLAAEGGWSDHPNDYPTNRGIRLSVFKKYGHDLDFDGDIDKEDLKILPKELALSIYKKQYWDKCNGDLIFDQDIAETLVDMGVNAGTSAAGKLMQRELNNQGHSLSIDGAIGPKSVAAINSPQTNPAQLFNDFNDARENFYQKIVANNPSKAVFLAGWLNRVAKFGRKVVKDAINVADNYTPTISNSGKKKVLFISATLIIGSIIIYKYANTKHHDTKLPKTT